MTGNKKPLKGKAEFNIYRNDMFWKCCIYDAETGLFYHIRWQGYNDSFWWDNVAEKNRITECNGKKFKINYHTLEVVEVTE